VTSRALTIMVVGRFYEEAFAEHIAETLVRMGHSVVRFEPGWKRSTAGGQLRARLRNVRLRASDILQSVPVVRRSLTRRLLTAARSERIDLTIVCHDFLLPAEVGALRDVTGAPAVLWFPDHLAQLGRAAFLNSSFDVLFFKDPFIVSTLRRETSARLEYLPECCNPDRHRPVPLSDSDRTRYGCEIATAGNMYPSRVSVFRQLNDFEVRIWGNPAPRWLQLGPVEQMLQGRFVANEEKSKAFLGAKVVVNNLHPAEVWGINVRAFEVCGIGACQVLTWRPGLQQLFDDGVEVISYRNVKELRALLPALLNDDDRRARVAEAGMRRARQEHTYERRLDMLIKSALMGEAAYPLPVAE
jgi:spore maturation protein CgeB